VGGTAGALGGAALANQAADNSVEVLTDVSETVEDAVDIVKGYVVDHHIDGADIVDFFTPRLRPR
jgi:hypothetical protein